MNTTPNIYLIIIAFVILFIGLVIWATSRQNNLATSLLYWLFFALFPVFMIFSFFPDNSTVNGTFLNFSLSGVFAGFVLIWVFGAIKTINASSKDELNGKIRQLEIEKYQLQNQLENAKIVNTTKPERLPNGQVHAYELIKVKNKKINLITGSLSAVENIDIWVNSENTNMQMASYFDRSISGTIRYYGAKRDNAGNVIDDIVNKELVKEMGGNISVMPATVFVTNSGELESSNGVKKIFHVASVQGTPGFGYRPVTDLVNCVRNALAKADSPELDELELHSILFPLLGTGQGGGELESTVKVLIETAVTYLETHPLSNINNIYFLTLFDYQRAACKGVLETHMKLKELKSNERK